MFVVPPEGIPEFATEEVLTTLLVGQFLFAKLIPVEAIDDVLTDGIVQITSRHIIYIYDGFAVGTRQRGVRRKRIVFSEFPAERLEASVEQEVAELVVDSGWRAQGIDSVDSPEVLKCGMDARTWECSESQADAT